MNHFGISTLIWSFSVVFWRIAMAIYKKKYNVLKINLLVLAFMILVFFLLIYRW